MLRYLSKALDVAGYIIQYGCITHCTFEYLGDFVVCSGPSMEPTLYSNNILIADRVSPRLHRLNRGDIVIAKCPTKPKDYVCKRVVALPGDKINAPEPVMEDFSYGRKLPNVQEETVDPNDEKADSPPPKRLRLRRDIIIPRGHVWVEGDNSEHSVDSRNYGPIPQGLIKSRALCCLWPPSELKLLV